MKYFNSNKNIDSFLIWAVLGVIIGGRTGYVIFYQLNEFLTNPFYLFEIWNGGMSFHGGLTGIIISTLILAIILGTTTFHYHPIINTLILEILKKSHNSTKDTPYLNL